MYSYHETSIFKIRNEDKHSWSLVVVEDTSSTIRYLMNEAHEALEEAEIRLAEAVERMARHGIKRENIVRTEILTSPSTLDIKNYADEHGFLWELDLKRAVFESRLCIRLRKTM